MCRDGGTKQSVEHKKSEHRTSCTRARGYGLSAITRSAFRNIWLSQYHRILCDRCFPIAFLCSWPRGKIYELSSLARTLRSWVRIPLNAWMSVCVYSVLCCPVCRWRPCNGLIARPRSPTVCVKKDYEIYKRPGHNKGDIKPLMNELMN
jgi:hypothetical protein